MTATLTSVGLISDAELVSACLGGDRDAFARIVERYQRLLCSLAYSATGSLDESEDVAQEAFVDAWRQLHTLREPEKLRPWLCGILRFKIGRLRRSARRELVRQAEPLEAADEMPSDDVPAADLTMNREEQAILWCALERVPELYREPLVLYYREHRSVEHVAVALEISEDAVKQRLARGRKILQEQVLSFVETALSRSTPGHAFTLGVLAALPEWVLPAKAAGFGAAVANGSVLAKATGVAALLASISGVVSAVLALRASLDQARTPRERRAVVKITAAVFFGAWALLAVLYLLREAAFRWPESAAVLAAITQVFVLAFIVGLPVAMLRIMRWMRGLRSAERGRHPELFRDPRDQVGSDTGEYRSRWKLLGVPLVHIRFSSPDEGERPVFGWIAGGDRAYGLLLAWGGYAVAPISLGAVAVGLFALGSVSIGVISVGTAGVGWFAIGCMAVGVRAYAWLSALGWQTAAGGGFSIARTAAEGPVAFAPHANDAVARQMLAAPQDDPDQLIFMIVISLASLIPIACYARAVRRRMGRQSVPEPGAKAPTPGL
ncbi:MAG: sigma-70 family RNA polymerase sigma factor [Verrucomicrobia bacterium]|nr:MAG: sigma-70 family RNA polymerase sigma factor [Verrucomicrobiota bacterium]